VVHESESAASETLGQRIRRQRRYLFLTQAVLADRLGVHQSNVARWENDESIPALRHRGRLAAELQIDPHILIEGVDEVAA
jgi:transcriptional regulator with XRE-family HTH domain